MPRPGLRQSASMRDIHHEGDRATESQTISDGKTDQSDLLRPETAASRGRPKSSASHAFDKPQHLPQLPSTSVSRLSRMSSNRYASDPQISTKYKRHASRPSSPPSEAAPGNLFPSSAFQRTRSLFRRPAPTVGMSTSQTPQSISPTPSKRKLKPFSQYKSFRSRSRPPPSQSSTPPLPIPEGLKQIPSANADGSANSRRPSTASSHTGPKSRGPQVPWLSSIDSRRSESAASRQVPGQAYAGFNDFSANPDRPGLGTKFKLPWRKKPEPLFPLPVRVSPPEYPSDNAGEKYAGPISASTHSTLSKNSSDIGPGSSVSARPRPSASEVQFARPRESADVIPGLPNPAMSTPTLGRNSSGASNKSARSSPPAPLPFKPNFRSRSSTHSSFPRKPDAERASTPYAQDSGRTSTASTTLGRNSIAGLRSLTSRLRQHSEPHGSRFGSPGSAFLGTSKSNSFAISRETLVVPEREEGETSGKYYVRLEKDMPKKSIALALSKSSDVFSHDVLRSLTRTFKFYEEPMDMSMRKFLWEIDLPGEAQQIDRVISAFAERYHECNPHIFNSLGKSAQIPSCKGTKLTASKMRLI